MDYNDLRDSECASFFQAQDDRRQELERNPRSLIELEECLERPPPFTPSSQSSLRCELPGPLSPNGSSSMSGNDDEYLNGALAVSDSRVPVYEHFTWFRDRWYIQQSSEAIRCCVCNVSFPGNQELHDLEPLFAKHEKDQEHLQKESQILAGAQHQDDLLKYFQTRCSNASTKELRRSVTKLAFMTPPVWRAPR